MNKTFAELGYNVGDTVRCVDSWVNYEIDKTYKLIPDETGAPRTNSGYNGYSGSWELVSRAGSANADDEYLIWSDMTPEAQGALLLAEHNGADIQLLTINCEWSHASHARRWVDTSKYRVKPADPVVVTHEISGSDKLLWGFSRADCDTHTITYNTIDGVIDCASVQMVEIDKP